MTRKTALQIALCALAGVLDFLGFVGFGLFPLAWIAWLPVLFAVRAEGVKRTFLLGMVFGTVAHVGGYYWVAHMLHEFGGIPRAASLLGMVLLCAYQGIVFALVLALVRHAEGRLGLAPVWSLAAAYPAVELLFPMPFPYFIGASQYRFTALTQVVELTGLLGLTALIALLNGAFHELVSVAVEKRRLFPRRVAVPAAVFAAVAGYGLLRIPMVERDVAAARTLRVALVQANLGARDKASRRGEFIQRHLDMTQEAVATDPRVEMVVWPETAYDASVWRAETNLARHGLADSGRTMLVGARTVEPGREGRLDVYNSALLLAPSGEVVGRFDKVQLLVFGETIPFVETFPALRRWFPRSSTFARGRTLRNLEHGGVSLLPMICYEDILPAFVRRLWREAGPANALVNLTNDSWYGDSHEPRIHLALATFRSIETRRALVRSTNTGISALVDPLGRITSRTGQWTRETLVGEIPLMEHGRSTPYMKAGDVVGWLACAAVALGLVQARRARAQAVPTS
jgi:apolipoprotein N-acyltransferase